MSELSAITLVTDDMAASLDFWLVPGVELAFGGPEAAFSTVRLGVDHVNLIAGEPSPGFWGRVVIHVPSPDDLHRALAAGGHRSETEPADAPWGERYFHILDPSGHEISFARRLRPDERAEQTERPPHQQTAPRAEPADGDEDSGGRADQPREEHR